MMAVNTTFKIGLVIGLAGAISSVIRRYSNWSTQGTVIVGSVSELDPDVLVQSRGVGQVAVWFNVPDDFEGECGEYPAAAIGEHLAELGFLRVVVAARNQGGGLCSFSP